MADTNKGTGKFQLIRTYSDEEEMDLPIGSIVEANKYEEHVTLPCQTCGKELYHSNVVGTVKAKIIGYDKDPMGPFPILEEVVKKAAKNKL